MDYAIGVDLGATYIKLTSVHRDGTVIDQVSCPTDDSAMGWADRVRDEIAASRGRRGAEPAWIGLSAPGLASSDGRSIAVMPGRLEGLEGLDWTDYLEVRRPIPVLNDAHAALLGEVWQGAARGLRHAVMLTLGTGVGGAVLADGRLLQGSIGRAGHLGHVCLHPDKPRDVVGIPGSLEDAIGNCTLEERSGGRFTSTHSLVAAHRERDPEASAIWLRSVYELACGIASIVNVLDPEVVILGGGIAQSGDDLFKPLGQFLDRLEWRPAGHRVRIVAAQLGDRAGALGAAYHAMEMASEAD